MIRAFQRAFLWIARAWRGRPGEWIEKLQGEALEGRATGASRETERYDPDSELVEDLAAKPVLNPARKQLQDALDGKVRISSALLFESRLGPDGRLLKDTADVAEANDGFDNRPYRMRAVEGHDAVVAALRRAKEHIEVDHPRRLAYVESMRAELLKRMREAGLFGDDFDGPLLQYDQNQYSEYTPVYGGPFAKQLYLYDYLLMHARAFEAWNHNPIAKRIVNMFVQYVLGRRIKAVSQKDQVKDAWEAFERKNRIYSKLSKYWLRELLIYGELMIDKVLWQSIDPSTVWDIITDPDNIDDVYYYHQTYPTAFQTFAGIQVPGVPGSGETKAAEYVIRQLPYDRVIHIKGQCVSNEKRGRSWLFPILGWLKRVKDLYGAEVVGAWSRACFIWDDTIDGSAADITGHLAAYNKLPLPGTIFAHNKRITRQVLAPPTSSGSGAGAGGNIANSILAFIAAGLGIPKEHFNIIASGGGSNRATALVGSEPFTKVIEELQSTVEELLLRIAQQAMDEAGVKDYEEGDLEFIFPSVTKDTTTETVKNIAFGEQMEWWDKETAAGMAAAEMNITGYDYDRMKKTIDDDKKDAATQADAMPGAALAARLGQGDGKRGIHGEDKLDQQDELNQL